MADIVRSEIIVVDTVEYNDYGDMLFTDKGGGNHKITAKRISHFKDVILPESAVTLNFAMAYNKEFIWNAVPVAGELPPPTKPVPPQPQPGEPTPAELKATQPEKLKISDSDKFKEYVKLCSFCLSYAKDAIDALPTHTTPDGIIPLAEQFYDWYYEKVKIFLKG